MIEAAEEALGFAQGRTRSDLETDRMLTRALPQSITILGEAASRVSAQGRSAAPTIPWPAIVAMRNRLVHAYFDVDLDLLWSTVIDNLPTLVEHLRGMLAANGS